MLAFRSMKYNTTGKSLSDLALDVTAMENARLRYPDDENEAEKGGEYYISFLDARARHTAYSPE